jgi:DivIVA domain-containing protein
MCPRPSGTPSPADRFPRCAEHEWGYDPAPVEQLLDAVAATLRGTREQPVTGVQVRAAVFDRARGGYRPRAVDEALDAAEDALAAAERERFLAAHGAEAWQRHLDELVAAVRGRLERPRTRRFRRPSRSRATGYSAAHVDVLCERVAARLEGSGELGAQAVRRAVFPAARGERCYEEQQVDAFLDRVVQLLLGLE